MSLESKIETLTASIDRLSNLLEKLGSVEPAEVIKKEAELLREEAKTEEKQVIPTKRFSKRTFHL